MGRLNTAPGSRRRPVWRCVYPPPSFHSILLLADNGFFRSALRAFGKPVFCFEIAAVPEVVTTAKKTADETCLLEAKVRKQAVAPHAPVVRNRPKEKEFGAWERGQGRGCGGPRHYDVLRPCATAHSIRL